MGAAHTNLGVSGRVRGLHYADPENVHHASTPERFELVTDTQSETVRQVMNQGNNGEGPGKE